jgi:hypothetical protein
MADAEEPAGHSREPGPEREVVPAVGDINDLGGIYSSRHHDRGDGIRVPLGRAGADFETPGLHRPPGAFGQPVMAGEDVLQPLLQQHRDGLA